MSKKFDIHEWQAKQRRLKEQKRPSFANQKYYDLLNDLRDEGHLHRYGVTQLQLKFGLKEKDAQEIYNQYKEDLNEHHAGDYNPGFLKQSVSTFLDKLKKKNEADYNKVEKIMEKYFSAKKTDEASMTGTGASFTPGTGAAYATPKAFGNNKNKKRKGYMGYKEI